MFTDRKLKEYNEREERFRLAVAEATANKSASINSIANKYRVSRTTLSRRIHGYKNTRNSHEKQQKFTNEEETVIVSQIQDVLRQSDHIPAKKEILTICETVLKDKYKERAPAEGENFFKVGKNWIDRFLERHNDKLMINGDTTLSEYYKSEFLTRKKLRSDRGYKTSTSTTPLSDQGSLQLYNPNHLNQQQYTYQAPGHDQEHHQQQLHDIPPPRPPYQTQSHSDSFVYQGVDHPPLGQVGGYGSQPYSLAPQAAYATQEQWSYIQQQQQQQPKQSVSHIMYSVNQQPLFSYSTGPQPINGAKPGYGNNPYYSQPPPAKSVNSPAVSSIYSEQGANQQFQSFNGFSFAQQQYAQNNGDSSNPNGQPTASSDQPSSVHSHAEAHSQENSPAQSTSQSQAPQTSEVSNESSGQLVPVSSNTIDPMQFYQGQRFQYESVRQRIIKELEREHVDVDNVVKLVNLSFAQIERDFGY